MSAGLQAPRAVIRHVERAVLLPSGLPFQKHKHLSKSKVAPLPRHSTAPSPSSTPFASPAQCRCSSSRSIASASSQSAASIASFSSPPRRPLSPQAPTFPLIAYPPPTHACGTLRPSHLSQSVRLRGWISSIRPLSKSLLFFNLGDASGKVQVVVRDAHLRGALETMREQDCVVLQGAVHGRGKDASESLATGAVEVELRGIECVGKVSQPLPFSPNDDHSLPNETFRLSHRVLDLRRARMTRNIQLRSKVLHAARNHLHSCNFTEIETPILLRSSPEGAREFLVPTRVHRSASDAPLGATRSTPPLPSPQFYALQQSPQQPKQLLIASGSTQRYFQIAKCFRDEDGRKDRQAEFTQLDVEMAFVSGAADAELEEEGWRMGGGEVKRTVEEFVGRMWNRARECEGAAPSVKLHPCPQRFRVMRWQEAMRRFGSDKPDLRYGLEIHSLVDEIGPRELQATEDWSKPGLTVDMLVYRPSQEAHSLSNKALADVVQKGSGIEAYKCKASSPNEVASVLLRKSAALRAYLHEAEIDAQDVDPSILCDAFEQALSKGALLSQIGNADAQNAESQHSDLCYVFVAGRKEPPEGGGTAMGDLRKRLARVLENKGALELSLSEPAFLWVTEFPLLTPSSAEEDKAHLTKGRRWTSTHHPFTAPMAQDLALLFGSAPSFSSLVGVRKEDAEVRGLDRQEQLARVRGQHYDLVLNGAEVGGGSVRIHCREVQEWLMSEVLQLTTEEIARFSALLNALSVGAPPHGGFALGVDRFLSILIGSQSIRDVIAFPKTGGGGKGLLDMVFESPARLSEKVGVHGREEEDEVLSAYALRTLEKDA